MLLFASQAEAAPKHQAIIIYHNDWGGAPNALKTELQNRGYTVSITDSAAQGLTELTNASTSLKSGDYLVVYLAGHGYDPRSNHNDVSKATAAGHFVQFNSGILYVSQSAPLFEQMANKGVNLSVIDGSCNGGEAVLYGIGQKYCVTATTGVYSPSLTGFPSPSAAMSKDAKPGALGLWWEPRQTASWMNGEIVSGVPERIHQRLFRNDISDIANLSLFLRPSISILTSLDLGGWNLHYQYNYLYRLIYPDEYAALDAAEKAKFTNSLQTFLTTMHTYRDPAEQFYTKLSGYLNNAFTLNSAASVYATQYDKVWRTLANDPAWNMNADPGKYASNMKGLTPDAYKGEAGFHKIAGEVDFLMTVLKLGYAQQEDLLKQIDAAAKDVYGTKKISDLIKYQAVKKAWPPEPGDPVKKFNQFERSLVKKMTAVDRQLKIDHRQIIGPIQEHASYRMYKLEPQAQKNEAAKTLSDGVALYKGGFATSISDKAGLSAGLINSMKKQKLEELIGKFKAISPTLYYAEGRVSFLLSIVEDSVGQVQSGGNSPCDTVLF